MRDVMWLSAQQPAADHSRMVRHDALVHGHRLMRHAPLLLLLLLATACGGRASSDVEGMTSSGGHLAAGVGGASETGGTQQGPGAANAGQSCMRKEDCGGEPCKFGRCPFAECNARRTDEVVYPQTLRCEEPEPACPPGHTPSLVNGCWGACVPVTACDPLDDCGLCSRSGLACARYVTVQPGSTYWCFPRPADCSPLTCDCAGNAGCRWFVCQGHSDHGVISCLGEELP
jgi:hypothetical protein